MGQGPSTKVTHLRLNQPPVFPVKLELMVCTDGHMLLCGQDQTNISFLVATAVTV